MYAKKLAHYWQTYTFWVMEHRSNFTNNLLKVKVLYAITTLMPRATKLKGGQYNPPSKKKRLCYYTFYDSQYTFKR